MWKSSFPSALRKATSSVQFPWFETIDDSEETIHQFGSRIPLQSDGLTITLGTLDGSVSLDSRGRYLADSFHFHVRLLTIFGLYHASFLLPYYHNLAASRVDLGLTSASDVANERVAREHR